MAQMNGYSIELAKYKEGKKSEEVIPIFIDEQDFTGFIKNPNKIMASGFEILEERLKIYGH